jgi:hypothetical protein
MLIQCRYLVVTCLPNGLLHHCCAAIYLLNSFYALRKLIAADPDGDEKGLTIPIALDDTV